VFWNGGDPGDKQTWRQYRAYSPGYVSPTEDAFLPIAAPWRAQGQTTRPWWFHSVAAVERHWDVQVAMTGIDWVTTSPRGVVYTPYAGGTPLTAPAYPHRDHDDVAKIRTTMCSSLRSFDDDPCKCTMGPKSSCTGG
jgi:hypothetical protein